MKCLKEKIKVIKELVSNLLNNYRKNRYKFKMIYICFIFYKNLYYFS